MSAVVRALGQVARLVPRRVALGVYGVPPLACVLRTVLNAVVPDGFQEVEVVTGPLAGARLLLDLKSEKYLWFGTYEPWVQEAIVRHLPAGSWGWDVGAFVGYHTLLMRRVAGPGRVVAIEPEPGNRARLERALEINGARDVVVLPVAVGKARGVADLCRVPRHPSQTSASLSEGGTCEMVSLDDLLERVPAPGLVKMDIEGGEDEALASAARLLAEVRPIWLLETHGEASERAVARLRKAGYRLSPIGKGIDAPADLPVGGPAHLLALP